MKFTNNLNLPQPLVDAVTNDPYNAGDCEISVTGLINAPRRRQLLKKYDDQIEEDISDRLWALFGQVGHTILERAAIDDGTRVIEKRFFAEVDDWVISGQLDLLQFQQKSGAKTLKFLEKGVLADYKIMSVWEIVFGMREEKVAQQNMLAWLCKMNGLRVEKLQIVSLLRDWSRTQAMRKSTNYPNSNIVVTSLPYWSMEKTEGYIRERIRAHKEAEELLPLCTAEERWHKDDKWAVIKEGRKSALRVTDSPADALNWCRDKGYVDDEMSNKNAWDGEFSSMKDVLKKGIYVDMRRGEDTRCEHYCAAAPFCEQFQETLEEGNK